MSNFFKPLLMRIIKITSAVVLSLLSVVSFAQKNVRLPLFSELNRIGNAGWYSRNPTAISDNPVGDMVRIDLGYGLSRGDFHDIDESSRTGAFDARVKGYHRFGKVDCFGALSYRYDRQNDRRWNSTMYISDANPFILADSVRSDFRIEEFDLRGGVSYSPIKQLSLGLNLRYLTGSSANQTDPRPKTDAMHLVINPGIAYRIAGRFMLGLSADIDILRESITHTIINTQESYSYFRFKGMGDVSTYTSSSLGSYPRNYSGQTYRGAFQFSASNRDGSVSDFLELYYLSGGEDARDGGTAFTFMGGDFSRSGYGLSNRFMVRGPRLVHEIALSASYEKADGIWYDQRAERDPNNNNAIYYKILNKALINRTTERDLSLGYRMDFVEGGRPVLSWFVSGRMLSSETLHYEGDGYMQKYTKVMARLGAVKHVDMRRCLLSVSLAGEYALPLEQSMRAMEKLLAEYTAPAFEYASASQGAGLFNISAQFPVDFSGFSTWIGVYADAQMRFYTGNSKFSSLYDSTRFGAFKVGVNLIF